ncbi:hypothetical protein PGT21_028349 [Puccinia graminis f. sp. tritici]|uniref:CCHC-type domain-containing protein n=1 Tax=Puccinia graminis f. sp. tritici TaxID=56615 RepID=A0A5B0QQ18_PUCGR|nr:hypothetical protein PGT21_028349 [Puccinia graminis f. sp. tritici]
MPPGDPPPLPPPDPTGNPLVRTLTDSIHNQADASTDVNMFTALEDRPSPTTAPHRPVDPPLAEFPLLNFYKAIRADPARRSATGTLNIDATTEALLLQLMESKARRSRDLQLVTEELRDVRSRVTTIEAGQLTRKPPAPSKTYASTTAKSPTPPQPPTKSELVTARPGLTIIHSKTGTTPLKEVDAEIVVQKTNEVLEKMNATVQGEKVTVKAVRFLPSGDVSFYSKNRQHKEWLNKNKHQWSKQIHPDLEATPSTYSILAHGIPRAFNVNSATGKIQIAAGNQFMAEKIFKMRWLGGSRDPNDPRQAGTVVIAFTDQSLADNLVRQRGLFLNSSFHRVERFKKLPPQCFKCLQMGHFGKWCRGDPKCGKCGEKHETRDCQGLETSTGKICIICKEGGKDKECWESHTPFDKACGVKRAWLISKNHIRHE